VHSHAHDGSHPGQAHSHGLDLRATGILGFAVIATLVLVLIELSAGYAAHSMALVSDAVHNLTDVPTLVISWLAMRWSLRPPNAEKTFGYHRAGILAAFSNAMVLGLAAFMVIGGSISRLRSPVEVGTRLMLWVSILALVINGGITLAVHSGRRDLNVRTVWLHNLGDALSNVGIIVGALLIRWTGAGAIDAIIGIAIGLMVLWSAQGILRESGHILLEGLPRGMHLENVAATILRVHGVQEVHDIHVWTLGTDVHSLSCHVRIPDMHLDECEKILGKIREALAHDFQITHATVQFERAGLPIQGLYMPAPAEHGKK